MNSDQQISGTVTVLSGRVYMAETLDDVVVYLQAADVKKEVMMENN
ncbi:MAG: hypothetical protein KKD28_04355 [Chloroflexi bacterium]|nr:hypothetical protein [Chloroflexota bacterium]